MKTLEQLKMRYPGALAWPFGDSAELADELCNLVISGRRTATCSALTSFQDEDRRGEAPLIGSYNIILNGSGSPVCVIRIMQMRIIRFCDVAEELASKEGEGDLSLAYWQQGHRKYFERGGTWSADMELVFEEFELIEVL